MKMVSHEEYHKTPRVSCSSLGKHTHPYNQSHKRNFHLLGFILSGTNLGFKLCVAACLCFCKTGQSTQLLHAGRMPAALQIHYLHRQVADMGRQQRRVHLFEHGEADVRRSVEVS